MDKEIKFYKAGQLLSFTKATRDGGASDVIVNAGPCGDVQMQTWIEFSAEEAEEILEAALKLIKG